MYWLDPWLAWHVPMSATGSITLRWPMQNAINHSRTHSHFPLHKRSLVTLIILIFRNWSYLTGEKVNQPLLPWPCPRQEFTFLPLKRYQQGHQHFILPPNDYTVLLERMCHEAQLLLPYHVPHAPGTGSCTSPPTAYDSSPSDWHPKISSVFTFKFKCHSWKDLGTKRPLHSPTLS